MTFNFIRLPEISNISEKQKEVHELLTKCLDKKFQSECNTNTLYYSQKMLDGYCYVPMKHTLWEGRYCRYLCFQDIMKVKLKTGGFVIDDNGYSVTIKNNKKVFKVNKRNKYWFMIMTEEDQLLAQLKNILK